MKRFVLLLAVAGFSWSVTAQITIRLSDFQAQVGSRYESQVYLLQDQHLTQLGPILNASGPNQTYDFTPYTYNSPLGVSTDIYSSAAGTPGENDTYLNQANYVTRTPFGDNNSFSYAILNESGYFFIGSVFEQNQNGNTTLIVSHNEPGDITHQYPLTYQTSWTETVNFTSEFAGTLSTATITNVEVVDGWGTLVTPLGSEPVLRLKKNHVVETNGVVTTTIAYIFITASGLSANIITDEQGNVPSLGASYSMGSSGTGTSIDDIPSQTFALFENYPNPFSTSSTITYQLDVPGRAILRIFDLTGREVITLVDALLPAGSYRQEVTTAKMSSGVYIYQLQVDGAMASRQFIVLK